MKLLFQGDSVTDVWRTEPSFLTDNAENLGLGYVAQIAERIKELDSAAVVQNRGVSGNRVIDLKKRWEKDCIALKPDVLTVLIGINDCWRKYDANDETPVEQFYSDYDFILKEVKTKTNAKIILMEPFVLPFPEDRKEWRVTLDPMIKAVHTLAKTYADGLVRLDRLMNDKSAELSPSAITFDGVHPNFLGHSIIAKAWLEEYSRIMK